MTRVASLCERRVKAPPRLLHFVSALTGDAPLAPALGVYGRPYPSGHRPLAGLDYGQAVTRFTSRMTRAALSGERDE